MAWDSGLRSGSGSWDAALACNVNGTNVLIDAVQLHEACRIPECIGMGVFGRKKGKPG